MALLSKGGSPGDADAPRVVSEETRKERVDRELQELLQGLRVALPGVQVLFAFLLTVPFASGFARANQFQRHAFAITLLAATVSSICFIAPAAQHRLLFRVTADQELRTQIKEQLLRRSNWYGITGTASLAVAMVAAQLMLVDFLFGRYPAVTVAAAVAFLATWSWMVQPLLNRFGMRRVAGIRKGNRSGRAAAS
ncbi:DUF6328 family protein [Carbonactinospora thermoautotrophica]|uniref:DUF6328 family protein n=1 Tax=Carbonactinospora thermoautotrophica TaxID=1469144 RepID=UPI0022721C65|nr:DUF6328 family protein [Carbonactinospora thermoautotrophica]